MIAYSFLKYYKMYAFTYYIKDYCNSLYHGLPRSSLAHLQMGQNAAADLTSAKKK